MIASTLMRAGLDEMRCLEKDRARRYEAANALARPSTRCPSDDIIKILGPNRSAPSHWEL
jgi:hypothetical protein